MKFRLIFPFLLSVLTLAAQMNTNRCTIRVDVVYASGGHASAKLRVNLSKGINGTLVAVANTNSLGTAEFADLEPGNYQAVVSGDGIETASSGNIEVNDWTVFQSQIVVVHPITTQQDKGQGSTVVVADLSIPPKAAKEYNRGNEEMKKKNWAKAIERFDGAIEIYPQFSAAYNNLAVCYGQAGQRAEKRKTLQKLLGINDRYVPALVNLSDMDIQDHDYSEAGSLLDKALALEPNNIEAIYYLAQVNLAQGQYDLAIAGSRRVHSVAHRNYALIHFTAASAFEHEGRVKEAISELQTFLQEFPDDPNADAARKAIAGLQRQSH